VCQQTQHCVVLVLDRVGCNLIHTLAVELEEIDLSLGVEGIVLVLEDIVLVVGGIVLGVGDIVLAAEGIRQAAADILLH